jgi:hypothetical protein
VLAHPSAGAVLSLCFVAQAYEHAEAVVRCFAELPFGAELLVQARRAAPRTARCCRPMTPEC